MESNRKELKIMFLKEVLKKKDDLFGAFSAIRTKETKAEAWKEVHNVAKALQLVPASKNSTYTRDVLWQNIKKASVKKRDNSRRTGTAGGPSAKINSIDELVYEIIGKESAVLDGLAVPESAVENEVATPQLPDNGTGSQDIQPKPPAAANLPTKSTIKPLKKKSNTDFKKLREKKLELTIKYLELKIEKTRREINALPPTPSSQAAPTAQSHSGNSREENLDEPADDEHTRYSPMEFADVEFLDDSD